MSQELLVALVGGGVALVTNVIAWMLASRKRNLELDSQQIDNEIKTSHFYKGLAEDINTQYEEVKKSNEELVIKIDNLEKQVAILMKSVCVRVGCTQRQTEYDVFKLKEKNKKPKEKKQHGA